MGAFLAIILQTATLTEKNVLFSFI